MSGDSHYLTCAINDEDYASLVYGERWQFDRRVISEANLEVHSAFKKNPKSILPRYQSANELPPEFDKQTFKDGYIDAYALRSFTKLFMPRENTQRFYEFQHLSSCPENILGWISGDEAPMAVLFFAIGFAAASKLPGAFGNALIHKDGVAEAETAVRFAPQGIDEPAWDRARRVISTCSAGRPSTEHDKEIEAIFSALPTALEKTRAANMHFLAFGFWFG